MVMSKQAKARLLLMFVCLPLVTLDFILAPHLPVNDPTVAAGIASLIAAAIVLVAMRAINKLFSL
jgi:hypothetical protein